MKKLIFTAVLFYISSLSALAQTRRIIPLDEGWRFSKGETEGAALPNLKDENWQQVTVPHDWAITGPFDKEIDKQMVAITQNGETRPTEKTGRTGALPYIGVGWYRIQLPQLDLNQRKATLMFDGAMSQAEVFINGKQVGHWPYGYNAFYFDITSYLNKSGTNLLAVRLENLPESSRWYPGAGLYRPVHLVLKSETSVATWGIQTTTQPTITSLLT